MTTTNASHYFSFLQYECLKKEGFMIPISTKWTHFIKKTNFRTYSSSLGQHVCVTLNYNVIFERLFSYLALYVMPYDVYMIP